MLTKAIIEEVTDEYSARVRIPIYHKSASSSQATPFEELPIATICTIPGCTYALKKGDVVFVDFELDMVSSPVIMGMLSKKDINSSSDITTRSLTVDVNCNLPDETYEKIKATITPSLSGLQSQIDLLKS